MTYVLGTTSRKRLEGVHPDLVKVVVPALDRSPVDFSVICGVRTPAEQVALYAKGRTTEQMRAAGIYDTPGSEHERVVTWTLNSNHFVRDSGFGHAVDLAPYVEGRIVWEPWGLFVDIANAMKEAAHDLDIPLEWGGDWQKPDGPHFQLPRNYE